MDKKWLMWSFVAGAVLAPVLVSAFLFASAKSVMDALPNAQGLTILNVPFLEYTTASGQLVEVKGTWLWIVIALFGGISCSLITNVIRTILKYARRVWPKTT